MRTPAARPDALPGKPDGTYAYTSMADHERRLFLERWKDSDEFDLARMRWLVAVRWIAVAAMIAPIVAGLEGFLPGVHTGLIIGVTAFGAVFNSVLHLALRRYGRLASRRSALVQAVLDLGMLTAVLYATGGLGSPFLGFYVFHVALVAILGGSRAAAVAAFMAFVGALFLILCEFFPLGAARFDPPPPWKTVTEVIAFAGLVVGTAYIAVHATRERSSRERALKLAHDRSALDYQLLSNTLDELDAGLEVLDEHGVVGFANRKAEELAGHAEGAPRRCPGEGRCEVEARGECPAERAFSEGVAGRCRFASQGRGGERVYERLTFPLSGRRGEPKRIMNLYVDRTEVALGERKLMVAERFASLGRIAQGVAHELNTPLATIRTLATDMREALESLDDATTAEQRSQVAKDLDESAALIRDETLRLGRITHALLAGGDLARARMQRGASVVAIVERARALVVAGLRGGFRVTIDDSVGAARSDVDPDRLMQVMVNLLQNGVDAMRTGGGSSIVVRAETEGESLRLIVEDDGPGLDPGMAGRLFEPFATTKPPGEGTGLGLYASYMLARSMGGDLTLENGPEGGARATVTLPRSQGGSSANPAPDAEPVTSLAG